MSYLIVSCNQSHPSRVCGLKLDHRPGLVAPEVVTPFTGVWIEIPYGGHNDTVCTVTPFTGVWIEIPWIPAGIEAVRVTPFTGVWIEIRTSIPVSPRSTVTPFTGVWIEIRRRGAPRTPGDVTPFTGVWIEILLPQNRTLKQPSHPSRVCGLKFLPRRIKWQVDMSHPSRVCGLKFRWSAGLYKHYQVTPFTGVWIEIGLPTGMRGRGSSHPSRVCGLKSRGLKPPRPPSLSHPSRVCGLKSLWCLKSFETCRRSHPSRVCGLKL